MTDARAERRAHAAALAIALAAPLLRLAPVLYGHLHSNAERVFLGIGYIPKDFVSYAAFMVQAQRTGAFFLRNDFTLEAQEGRYVLLLHYIVGRLAAWFDTDIVVIWPIVQWVAGAALLLGVWRLLRAYFESPGVRLLGLALVAFSGGFEWIAGFATTWLPPQAANAVTLACWPLLSWNTFEGLFNPLQTTAYAAGIWLFVLLEAASRARRPLRAFAAFVIVPAMYAVHGYTAIACGSVLAVTFALLGLRVLRGERDRVGEWIAVGIAGAAFVIPLAVSRWQSQDAVFRSTAQQMVEASQVYGFWWWPITFGAVLVLAVVGFARMLRRSDSGAFRFVLLEGWVLAGLVLAHLPRFSAYKFLFVLHVPLAIGATEALAELDFGAARRLVFAGLAIALLATNVVVTRDAIEEIAAAPYFYLDRSEHEALTRMRTLAPGAVLASPVTGAYVPWLAEKPVYLGQWFLSLEPGSKWEQVKRFFASGTSTAWRRAFLARNGIHYLYYGKAERRLGPLDPALPLSPVVEAGDVRVYRVDTAAP